ncbi:hypothetical protein SAMD00079811_08490 [Scytonema sp. HK-05]|nr:hypothetical protein SAMD00079811_08490 [Scytonema sp. HK-05]
MMRFDYVALNRKTKRETPEGTPRGKETSKYLPTETRVFTLRKTTNNYNNSHTTNKVTSKC